MLVVSRILAEHFDAIGDIEEILLFALADDQVLAIGVPSGVHDEVQAVALLHEEVLLLVLVQNERSHELVAIIRVVRLDDKLDNLITLLRSLFLL